MNYILGGIREFNSKQLVFVNSELASDKADLNNDYIIFHIIGQYSKVFIQFIYSYSS